MLAQDDLEVSPGKRRAKTTAHAASPGCMHRKQTHCTLVSVSLVPILALPLTTSDWPTEACGSGC
jgi:hypothetical protein